jgi:alkylresorcinol/alkylpyrone synthase
VNHPRILSIGTANPTVRLTQEQSFHAAGCQGERIRKIFLSSAAAQQANRRYPQIIDFETFIDREQIDEVGLQHRDGKLRIVLGASVQQLSGPMLETALQQLLQRHGLSRSRIGFWVVHPGGRKVIDNVQKHFGMTDAQLRFSRTVLRNYGNMSSPTVMFVLDEVVRSGDPQPGDWGVMIALGPGMAAEVALLRW